MGFRTSGVGVVGTLLAGALLLGGCATKEYVNQQVGGVSSRLDAHDARLAGLDKSTREALERAEAAGKLAEGKFVYSLVLSDASTKFPSDSSKLSPAAQSQLADLAARLKADNKNVYLEIQGYTDSMGSPAANLRLGDERAETVRRFLSQQGVALNRMATISYGEENPVASNRTRAGRAQNRRVVIVVLQ